jgi:hypothetical protein
MLIVITQKRKEARKGGREGEDNKGGEEPLGGDVYVYGFDNCDSL